MADFQITQQDRAFLTLVAKHEARSYDTIYGGREIPLTQMLIAEVLEYQRTQMRNGSTAVGRYQMLRDVVAENARGLGLDPTQVRLTADVQDQMMLYKVKRYRKYNEWLAGSLGSTPLENTQKFCIYVAAEWASCPVPYDMPAGSSPFSSRHPRRNLLKGQSFYAGDGLNRAHHDADTFVAALLDIQAGGTGEVTTIPSVPAGGGPGGGAVAPAGSEGYPQSGTSPQAQIQNYAAGGSRYQGQAGNSNVPLKGLPAANNVYDYEVIDPLDDRYDFRTGKKVSRILENGVTSVAANAPSATNTPASDFGTAPNTGGVDPQNWTEEDLNRQLENRDADATRGRFSEVPNLDGANTNAPSAGTDSSAAGTSGSGTTAQNGGLPSRGGSAVPADGLTGGVSAVKRIPNPSGNTPTPPATTSAATDAANKAAALNKENPLKSPFEPISQFATDTPKPGLDAPVASTPENDNSVLKKNKADQLQQQVFDVQNNIKDIIALMKGIYDRVPSQYLGTLRARLANAQIRLSAKKAEYDAAQLEPENTVLIEQINREIFNTESEIKTIQTNINKGSPYGLSVVQQITLTTQQAEYNALKSQVQTQVARLTQLETQARQSSLDIYGTKYTGSLSEVPPSATFK